MHSAYSVCVLIFGTQDNPEHLGFLRFLSFHHNYPVQTVKLKSLSFFLEDSFSSILLSLFLEDHPTLSCTGKKETFHAPVETKLSRLLREQAAVASTLDSKQRDERLDRRKN